MKRGQFSNEQIIAILKEQEAGMATADVCRPHGIRANAVSPGWVDTPLGLHGFRDGLGEVSAAGRAAALRSRASVSPLGLTGTPNDIALAVLYLASDASRFVTGQILRPNGGVAMP